MLYAHWRISAHPGRGRPGGVWLDLYGLYCTGIRITLEISERIHTYPELPAWAYCVTADSPLCLETQEVHPSEKKCIFSYFLLTLSRAEYISSPLWATAPTVGFPTVWFHCLCNRQKAILHLICMEILEEPKGRRFTLFRRLPTTHEG